MQVAFGQQSLLQPRFDALAEQGAIRQHNRGPAAGFEQADEQGQKQIGRFAGAELGREVVLNAVFLLAAEGWIGDDHVHLIGRPIIAIGPGQGVVTPHEAGILDAMQQHVGDAQHVGNGLLLDQPQGGLHRLLIGECLHITLAHVANRAGDEATGAPRGVQQQLAGLRIDAIDHEAGHASRRVVLAGIAGTLQIVEQLLVHIAKMLAVGEVIEINAIHLVDHLPQQLT